MMDKMLKLIDGVYRLTEKDAGEFASFQANGMKFTVKAYEAEGLGWVSTMQGVAMMGLMKMDTLVVNPFEQDMALFSYDRIYAMGNDTLFLELYDTRLERKAISPALSEIVASYADIPEEPVAPNWYDSIKFKESIKKKGKKAITPRFDEFTEKYLAEYLNLCQSASSCNVEQKKEAASEYTEGLLTHGGPSTDAFFKSKGKEFTETFFRNVFFATGEPKK